MVTSSRRFRSVIAKLLPLGWRVPLAILFLESLSLLSAQASRLSVASPRRPLAGRESQIWASAVHRAKFEALKQAAVASDCERTVEPEAIATPNPLIDDADSGNSITLSFIIGTDGRVHSPLILENSDDSQNAALLNTVRLWRYRPALCNGVPMESEGRVEFSHR